MGAAPRQTWCRKPEPRQTRPRACPRTALFYRYASPAQRQTIGGFKQMFVFKTAVVGAGTMGGEIAQTLAAADLPVVLKDVDKKFVDQGLEKARQVTENQLQGLVKKEKISEEQAAKQLDHTVGLITGTTGYEGF